ncbi:ATP-binding cassette domain-containing protein [Candidatus Riflebacteria bacterium]
MSVVLELNAIGFYRDERILLEDIDLELKDSEIAIIMGQSGSGKGLLLRICCGLIKQNNGDIIFCNKNLREMDYIESQNFRRKVGFIFEGKSGLVPELTLFENITLPFLYFGESTKTIKALVQLYLTDFNLPMQEGFFELYPYQCTHFTNALVQVLRAVLMQPKVILLENPFSLLGIKNAQVLFQFIVFLQQRLNFAILLGTSYINFPIRDEVTFYLLEGGELKKGSAKQAMVASSMNLLVDDGDV